MRSNLTIVIPSRVAISVRIGGDKTSLCPISLLTLFLRSIEASVCVGVKILLKKNVVDKTCR